MSQENVELVRHGLEAFARGERELPLDRFDAELEWQDPPSLPGGSLHRGHKAVRARWSELDEHLIGFTVIAEAYYDAGDRVVVFLRTKGRGRTSGIDYEREIAQVFTVADGVVTSVIGYDDRDEALAAAARDTATTVSALERVG